MGVAAVAEVVEEVVMGEVTADEVDVVDVVDVGEGTCTTIWTTSWKLCGDEQVGDTSRALHTRIRSPPPTKTGDHLQ